ncbi:hypothetical protein N7340_16270 [Comamonas aquatica]|uniref:hypothetical protein n=1 Tax=Comamonas aquatica TaxID=225991 RepID=UPI00244B28C5|nr:hypothetical protein [Comamonas aquatica]MDH0373311.1 hypothetical protein [Comamonas aquatica]
MSQVSMRNMEASIPSQAQIAAQRARLQALAISGKVLEARDGHLVEIAANGTVRVLRHIAKPIPVALGAKRFRAHRAAQP